ncbi:TetR/AcrR family transcriptional regulator C-terminal domain-containing protein [Novosphingobium sp. SG720]|uniref:TetR/AcrR family transcriptional regulator C-terminal domain-containing protein n=1 Tax=Novosphingobium sp. SG720 TaxID=2586998 RepID=UPI0014468553|nr:TetR/AcrR family transcriptional regulator C-terminal domain-containing protein [Novosphingobium sp. SG720]
MIHHARAQIMAVGVDRFSVNEVLRLSGGSKATLVKYFGDRTGLIAAAIRAEAETTLAALALENAESRTLPLAAALHRMLLGVLRFYLTPGALALYRAVVSAAADNPAGAIAFYEQGHRIIAGALAALLHARQPDEVRPDVDCARAADIALHAIRAGLYEQVLIGLDVAQDDAAVTGQVEATVALLLPGLAAAKSA